MKISVLGCGWFGLPLAEELLRHGHSVQGSSRSPDRLNAKGIRLYQLRAPALPAPELLDCDVLVLNVPPFEGQLEWFKSWAWQKRLWVIFVSSTGANPLLAKEEKWIEENFADWSILKFGGLVGPGRHPGRHLSGKKDLPGRLWPINLLLLEDAIGFTTTVIKHGLKNSAFNVVSEDQRTREEFYTAYCKDQGLAPPLFNQDDLSTREKVSNEKARGHYRFRMIKGP